MDKKSVYIYKYAQIYAPCTLQKSMRNISYKHFHQIHEPKMITHNTNIKYVLIS